MGLIGSILIAVIILAIVFLILREVVCWYYKINEHIDLLNEQNKLLMEIISVLNCKTFNCSQDSEKQDHEKVEQKTEQTDAEPSLKVANYDEAEELAKLKAQFEEGKITAWEYNQYKKRILDKSGHNFR